MGIPLDHNGVKTSRLAVENGRPLLATTIILNYIPPIEYKKERAGSGILV